MVFVHHLGIHLHITSVKYCALLLPSQKETEDGTWVGWPGLVLVMDTVKKEAPAGVPFPHSDYILLSPPLSLLSPFWGSRLHRV